MRIALTMSTDGSGQMNRPLPVIDGRPTGSL